MYNLDLVKELKSYHCSVKVHDPFVKPNEALENGIIVEPWKELKEFDIFFGINIFNNIFCSLSYKTGFFI